MRTQHNTELAEVDILQRQAKTAQPVTGKPRLTAKVTLGRLPVVLFTLAGFSRIR